MLGDLSIRMHSLLTCCIFIVVKCVSTFKCSRPSVLPLTNLSIAHYTVCCTWRQPGVWRRFANDEHMLSIGSWLWHNVTLHTHTQISRIPPNTSINILLYDITCIPTGLGVTPSKLMNDAVYRKQQQQQQKSLMQHLNMCCCAVWTVTTNAKCSRVTCCCM